MQKTASLSEAELERYARHIVMPEVGGTGQQKLKAARVLVVGAGGLGSPALQYLAAAGVGTVGIVDPDMVSLSNLQRQTIHTTAMQGYAKVESAARAIVQLNPNTQVETWPIRLTEENGYALVSQYDLAIDGSDNFETRYLMAELCEDAAIPLVSAAVGRFDGSITTLLPFEKNSDGSLNPRYLDLFPEPPQPGTVANCEAEGILGALTGIIGSLQAMEAIKLVTGVGECLIGRLLMIDAASMTFTNIRYSRMRS